MQQGSHSQDPRPQNSRGARKEPPTIDITPDGGYRVYPGSSGGQRTGPAPRSAKRLGGFLTLAVVGLVLIGAFALGILTFLIAIPVAIGAVVAALVAGFVLRHRMRNAAGRPPGPTG